MGKVEIVQVKFDFVRKLRKPKNCKRKKKSAEQKLMD